MSDDYKVTKTGADKFNEKAAFRTVGWGYALPMLVDDQIDDHGMPEDVVAVALAMKTKGMFSRPFRKAVEEYQKARKLSVDGKLGGGTWAHMRKSQEVPDFGFGHIKVAKMLLAVPDLSEMAGVDIEVIQHEEPFDGYRPGCESKSIIVVHWGGLDVDSCHRVLESAGISTHLMASPEVDDDDVYRIYQGVDLVHTAWHAGNVNSNAIGIDICRSPLTKYKDRYTDPKVIANPMSGHLTKSQKRIVALPEDMALAFRVFLGWLAKIFNVPYGAYPGDGAIEGVDERIKSKGKEGFTGVIGHHNVPAGARVGKWDVAPWASQIWNMSGEN